MGSKAAALPFHSKWPLPIFMLMKMSWKPEILLHNLTHKSNNCLPSSFGKWERKIAQAPYFSFFYLSSFSLSSIFLC